MKNILMEKVKILRLEGAEILKNNLEGMSIDKDYKCVMDSSLLLNKLYDLKLSVNGGRSKDIIMVTFKYGYDDKVNREMYKELKDLKGEVKENIEERKQLKEERKMQENNKAKKPYTDAIKVLEEDSKKLKEEIKLLEISIDENKKDKDYIRDYLYENGFKLDFYKKKKKHNMKIDRKKYRKLDNKVHGNIVKYKRYIKDKTIDYELWFRTSAKARVGNVFFINKELLNDINDWQNAGIELPPTDAKVVENEAYKSLTASALEDLIEIKPSEILVINDLESHCEKLCNLVKTRPSKDKDGNIIKDKDGKEVLECYVEKKNYIVKNILFDGQALGDESLFKGKEGMKLLRNHYFKNCAFRSKIKQFFIDYCTENDLDYNTFKIKDRYNNDIFVKDIKLITTENAMKWEKFYGDTKKERRRGYSNWSRKIKKDGCLFGVVKTDHESKYGNKQRMSYQMLNSLIELDKNEVAEICKPTVDFIENMKNNNDKFIEYLQMTKNEVNENEMIIHLFNKNPKFKDTKFYKTYKSKSISKYKETLKSGKLLFEGDNLTVVGNPYLMLIHSVGEVPHINNIVTEDFEDVTLPKSEEGVNCYTRRFADGEELAGFRNPHNAPHNILWLKNNISEIMDKYFNFSRNIIAINLLKNDVQDRANGMDMDSDFIYATNNKKIVDVAKECKKYATIVNKIDQDKKKYDNTLKSKATIDKLLAKGKNDIGLSSNLAQLALSWWQDSKDEKLEDIVCICSVLAQVAIDNAKRKYIIDVSKEVARINGLPCMDMAGFKPYFWQFIKEIKEKDNVKRSDDDDTIKVKKIKAKKDKKGKEEKLKDKCLDRDICIMDMIERELDNVKDNTNNKKGLDIVELIKIQNGKAKKEKLDKIESLVEELDNLYKKHYAENKENDDEEWVVESILKTSDVLNKISKIKVDPKTMQTLVARAFTKNKNKKYTIKMLKCLYNTNKEAFLSIF